MAEQRVVIMIGPSMAARGGIASVAKAYQASGLFERWRIRYLETFVEGSGSSRVIAGLKALIMFIALLARGQVGLVHAHVATRTSFLRKSVFLLMARLFGIPTILHLHGADFDRFFENECGSVRQSYIRYVFRQCSAIIVLSDFWLKWVDSMSAHPRVIKIYNPAIFIDETDSPTGQQREPSTLLFLGRMGDRKGIFDLLAIMPDLVAVEPSISLRCGGDGDVDKVRKVIAELRLDQHVTLLGWVSGKDKDVELQRASIYVLPSYHEGLPMAVLEAMAAGMPVVSTTVGGIPEAITNGKEGFLIAPGDRNALLISLQRLLLESSLRDKMGVAAKKKALQQFSIETAITKLSTLYASLGIK